MTVEIKARILTPPGDEHFVCSKSRASVLVCRYGFCSIDHYCSTNGVGSECSDTCACCMPSKTRQLKLGEKYSEERSSIEVNGSLSETTDMRTRSASSPHGLKTNDLNTICAVSEAKEAAQDPCNPGKHKCIYGLIYFCTSSDTWLFIANCGDDAHCIPRTDGTAYCLSQVVATTLPEGIHGSHPTLGERKRDFPVASFRDQAAPNWETLCKTLGAYRCLPMTGQIVVCDSVGYWQISAYCAGPGRCVDGPSGTAYCLQPSSKDISYGTDETTLDQVVPGATTLMTVNGAAAATAGS